MNNAWPSLEVVGERLGLKKTGRARWGGCPACGIETTSDGHGPLRFRGQGWFCVTCQVKGDALSLVARLVHGVAAPRGRVYWRCTEWLEGHGAVVGATAPPEPVVRIDPMPALRRAVPISEVSDPRLTAWLTERCIPSTAPAGWLPDFYAPWWPGYARMWPVVVPACTGRGEVQSMQGLAIDQSAPMSKIWPKGAAARELLFADASARAWLAGRAPPPRKLVIVEGVPDYLTATSRIRDATVIGISAGGAAALRLVTLTASTEIFVGTHQDATGHDYRKAVCEAFESRIVRPLPLWRIF